MRTTLLLTLALIAAGCGGGGAGDDTGDDVDADTGGPVIEPGDPGASDVQLDVRTDTARRAISPWIYGINGGPANAADRPTVVRAGGNRLTAYNWEINASNAGSDYCNQNDGLLGGPGSSPANAFRSLLDDARARGTAAIVTVPIVDHVAADHDDLGDGGQGPPACVGDVQNSGGNYLQTRFAANHARKPGPFAAAPDLTDDAVYQDELVAYLAAGWSDVPVLVSLDNEPDLWAGTHARIHPAPVTYAELTQRNAEFATAVKDAWPAAQTLGFVSYGYAGYTTLQGAPDAGGNGEFLGYYLDAMAAAGTAAGHRVIDHLDLHWYTEARGDGVRCADVPDARCAAARVQATRSLWDPGYREDSWIVNDVLDAPIRLIPWVQDTIAARYPGTGLALTEWNYGGGNHVSGALATADALGIFGREGVSVATLWLLHGDEPYTRAGLRAFTSHDGAGAAFAETSVSAQTSDVARVTVYASHGADGRVVIIAINKDAAAVTAGLRVAAPRSYARARRWVLDGDAPALTEDTAVDIAATNAFLITLPASSVTVLVPE